MKNLGDGVQRLVDESSNLVGEGSNLGDGRQRLAIEKIFLADGVWLPVSEELLGSGDGGFFGGFATEGFEAFA